MHYACITRLADLRSPSERVRMQHARAAHHTHVYHTSFPSISSLVCYLLVSIARLYSSSESYAQGGRRAFCKTKPQWIHRNKSLCREKGVIGMSYLRMKLDLIETKKCTFHLIILNLYACNVLLRNIWKVCFWYETHSNDDYHNH